MDIGVGDWVEMVSVDPGPLRVGSLYRIARLLDDCEACVFCGDESFAAALAGDPRPDSDESFWCVACELRPIYRPKASLIESLKAPPKRVKESA